MRLIYERGGEEIAFPLDEGETWVGRKDDCDIYFPDGGLSKRHARLLRRGGALEVEDCGSRNGTFVNGEQVHGRQALRTGDVLQLGKLHFRIAGVGASRSQDYDFVEDESSAGHRRSAARGDARGHGRSADRGGDRSTSGRRPAPGAGPPSRASAHKASGPLAVAKAVRSGEIRASMLEEFPAAPPSIDGESPLAAPEAGARFRLVDGGPAQAWDLTGEAVTVGSKEENAICIRGEGVSRYHAEVVRDGASWLLKDLGARNGIFVGGNKVDVHALQDGDEVQIGTIRLRFELVRPSPLAGLGELLGRLAKDPVGTYKREPHVRIGAAALVVALVLCVAALPAGTIVGPSKPLELTWCLQGTEKLEKGEFQEAREIFRKANAQISTDLQRLPNGLMNLAGMYQDLEKKGPMAFRWGKAEDTLKEALRLPQIPERTQRWIERQLVVASKNRQAYDKLVEAETTAGQASQLGAQRQWRDAIRRYEEALSRYADVDRESAFASRANQQSAQIRDQIFQLAMGDVRERMRAAEPDWYDTVEVIDQVVAYTASAEQRSELRRLRDECETNARDETYYKQATDIVGQRVVTRYPEAQRLLDRIDQRSRIYPDARAYLQWIEADLQVRQAQKAYENGDDRRAFELLRLALQHDVLGREAIKSVSDRNQAWSRVVKAYQLGTQALKERRNQEALEEFQRVVQLEPNRANRFHELAVQQIQHLRQLQSMSLDRKLKQGLDALQNGQWDQAYGYFRDVHQDQNRTPRELQIIQEAVVDANQSRNLLRRAIDSFRADDKQKFLDIWNLARLLKRWLPPGHRDRPAAEKLYEDVRKRLRVLEMIRPNDE